MIETGTEIRIVINLMKKEIEDMMEMIEEDDKKTEEEIQKLIDKIKEIRQRKTDKEIKLNPKRKGRIQGECNDMNEELDEMIKEKCEEREGFSK